ncbi:MAG: CsiV family protein [Woeseiaceae bacterium]|nr:CsiV family protein [Woeseiaceae bacterium]
MRKLILSLFSLVLSAPAYAQQPDANMIDAEEEEIRRYTIEVIVFRYAQEVATGSEVFPPDKPERASELGQPVEFLEPLRPEPAEEEEPEPLPDTELTLLAEEDYQLVDIHDRMRRLDVYEPVMHFGWTQATWPEEATEAVPLARFARPPEGLDGTLELYRSRFLHLVVDLAWQAPDVGRGQEYSRRDESRTVGDLLSYTDDDQSLLRPTYYRIQDDRILKNGELRYFDHPKFGVLAKVTRVEESNATEAEDGELLGYGTE